MRQSRLPRKVSQRLHQAPTARCPTLLGRVKRRHFRALLQAIRPVTNVRNRLVRVKAHRIKTKLCSAKSWRKWTELRTGPMSYRYRFHQRHQRDSLQEYREVALWEDLAFKYLRWISMRHKLATQTSSTTLRGDVLDLTAPTDSIHSSRQPRPWVAICRRRATFKPKNGFRLYPTLTLYSDLIVST